MRVILTALVDVIRACALLLALGSAAAALAAWGGLKSDWFDVLTHFAPFCLAGGVLALGAGLAAGGGRLTVIAATLAIVASVALMAPEWFAPRPEAQPPGSQTLKLLQFNLWERNRDPAGTARWIASQDADVVVLEEAFGATRSVPAALKTLYPYRTTCSPPFPCSTVILSKRKPSRVGGLEAHTSAVPLAAAWAAFDDPRDGYVIVGAHYTWPIPPGLQQAQMRRLAETLGAFDRRRLIVAGDFNLTPWSFSLRRQDASFGLQRRTRGLFTWPAAAVSRLRLFFPFPLLAIDQVYAGSDWRTVSVRRGPRLASDHYPVVVVLSRPPTPAPSP